MHDHFWSYNYPQYHDALRWSDDNHIAVACGHTVVVFNPCELNGPRAYFAEKAADVTAINPGCQPHDTSPSTHHLLACAFEIRSKDVLHRNVVRSLDWSPTGCSTSGGCLLAAITSDHKVRVYTLSDSAANSSLVLSADVSNLIHQQLQQPGGLEEMLGGGGAPLLDDPSSLLRLRGGGVKRRRSLTGVTASPHFAVGAAVEVMNNEEGLRGCWFTGTIQQLHRSHFALVEYEELMAEADPSSHLKEWFLLPGAWEGSRPPSRPPGPHPANMDPLYLMRPRVPDEQAYRRQTTPKAETQKLNPDP